MTWLNETDACTYIDRAPSTLRDWRLQRLVQAKKIKDTWYFDKESLSNARKQMEHNYRFRRIVPGSGRGRWVVDQPKLWED